MSLLACEDRRGVLTGYSSCCRLVRSRRLRGPQSMGSAAGPQAAQMPMSLHAAASLRAHAALTGEPWLGDAVSTGRAVQCPALPSTAALLAMQNPFAGDASSGAHGAQPLPADCPLSVLTGQQEQQGASEFEAYLASMQGDAAVRGETTSLGLAHMGSMAEGMRLVASSALLCFTPYTTAPVHRLRMLPNI